MSGVPGPGQVFLKLESPRNLTSCKKQSLSVTRPISKPINILLFFFLFCVATRNSLEQKGLANYANF